MFLASGLTRVFVATKMPENRLILIISGLISIGLGLWVFFNIVAASLTLLGVLLGIQVLMEGLTLIAVGRVRPAKVTSAA